MIINVLMMITQTKLKMALILLLMSFIRPIFSNPREEMALANVTRFASGDLFSLVGPECGMTRCMEVSHGTALAAMGVSGCSCQCARDTPAFREDQRICVNHIDECQMASYGRGATKPQIPFVFLPLKGQIVYPSKEIIFTDVDDAVCAVTSAQYLSPSGWLALRDLVDNDVPFALYRDEGSTYLQWRGSSALHSRLEGRLVTVHVLCSAPAPARLAASCAAFRVAGATHNTMLDVRSIPFHAGEIVNTEQVSQSKGLSVLESLAIGVCVLMLVFIYAAGIIFYIHYKQKQKRKGMDPESNRSSTASTENISTIDMDNVRLKKNPLLNLDNMRNDFLNDAGLSDVSERTEETMDSSTTYQKFQSMNPNIISAMIHTHRKKPFRPSLRTSTPEKLTERFQRRSASPEIERAPQSDLSIIDCSVETNSMTSLNPPTNVEPVIRRKLYFNPVFFEVEHLKNPPPAAIDFLIKIREIMAIAKEKMLLKRFIPMLSDIPEEDLYHTVDLGWDIPCARRGRRFSAISLKRENSRRAVLCGGCPGCDSSDSKSQKAPGLVRSNSCKTCVSDDYKQRIVQKWLDEVPSPPQTIRPTKSVAKVSGTPRIVETKKKDDVRISPVISLRRDESNVNKHETKKPTEPVAREKLSHLRAKQTVDTKRELEKPQTINSNQDNNRNEKKLTPPHSNKKPQEKKSPSNNATRRVVRKKLPPPPPPPVNAPEPIIDDKKEPVLPEVKVKMKAVIKELNKCKRSEESELEELRRLAVLASGPKIVIPVAAADSQYYSDDNTLSHDRNATHLSEKSMEFDSLDRNMLKRRRFSLDFGSEIIQKQQTIHKISEIPKERLSRSWRDIKQAVDATPCEQISYLIPNISTCRVNDLFVNPIEPLYNNIETPGPLTIEVRGSPVDIRQKIHDDFDPDTLDRKPRREIKKSVEKILLKSGGSFKHKVMSRNANIDSGTGERRTPPEAVFTRKIGSLRQIYEAKAKAQQEPRLYERRGSVPYANQDIAKFIKSVRPPDFRKAEGQNDSKPPIPSKQRRGSDKYSPPSERQRSEEKERVAQYVRNENLNARRSGRRSSRTRSRRVDLKKLCRTEDSGYLSTDSNESKCRARYLMLRPKFLPPEPVPKPDPPVVRTLALQIDSDTDEMESLCDGRSESGGESVETDSVFFGNFDESKEMFSELGLCVETRDMLAASQDQIDSGFAGETNITLSGDSDSEHRSVISIVTGRDGRSSVASITKLDDTPYVHSVEC